MSKIQLDAEELQALKTSMQDVISRIREVSSGGYVTENLFSESQGESSEMLSQCLEVLVKCANQMEDVAEKTSSFLGEVIEGFATTDSENAAKINSNRE